MADDLQPKIGQRRPANIDFNEEFRRAKRAAQVWAATTILLSVGTLGSTAPLKSSWAENLVLPSFILVIISLVIAVYYTWEFAEADRRLRNSHTPAAYAALTAEGAAATTEIEQCLELILARISRLTVKVEEADDRSISERIDRRLAEMGTKLANQFRNNVLITRGRNDKRTANYAKDVEDMLGIMKRTVIGEVEAFNKASLMNLEREIDSASQDLRGQLVARESRLLSENDLAELRALIAEASGIDQRLRGYASAIDRRDIAMLNYVHRWPTYAVSVIATALALLRLLLPMDVAQDLARVIHVDHSAVETPALQDSNSGGYQPSSPATAVLPAPSPSASGR